MTTTSVRRKRIEKGWTLSQLSEQCAAQGVTTAISNLHRIETGEQVPRPGLRVVLARLLDLDVNDDFEREAAS
jgi:transcriptional regulator with XRE-family HTH domain